MLNIHDIRQARERIAPYANRTVLDPSGTFSRLSGQEVFFKPENLQKTGAFKFRGAVNAVLSLSPDEGRRGVITGSSGNHGQAVACAARMAGYPATIVVPEDASSAKVDAIRGYGAEVLRCGRLSSERIDRAKQLVAERGMTFIHPFDDPRVMAGQGTIGLEILEDLEDVDAVLVPVGGGGLISGISTAVKAIKPSVRVYGVEPEGSCSMHLSVTAGRRTSPDKIETLADGLRTNIPGEATFEVVKERVDDILLIGEDSIRQAMRLLLERGKMLVEPSGAVTTAALLERKLPFEGKKVVAVLSGGNVAMDLLVEIIRERKSEEGKE